MGNVMSQNVLSNKRKFAESGRSLPVARQNCQIKSTVNTILLKSHMSYDPFTNMSTWDCIFIFEY